jgi:5'(3')-deoxyribonucleotidase
MTTSKEFILGVDLDGVCGDFYGRLREIAAVWLDVPIESLTDDVSYGVPEWNLEPLGGYSALHRFAVTQHNLFGTLKPMPGITPVLRRLSIAGIRIRIITHRLYIKHFHLEAIRQTVEWLDRNGIPYWDICFMGDKTAVGADLYIEDSPGNVAELRDAGCEVVVFANSTNKHVAPPRANSWTQVEAAVRLRFEEWKKNYPDWGNQRERK